MGEVTIHISGKLPRLLWEKIVCPCSVGQRKKSLSLKGRSKDRLAERYAGRNTDQLVRSDTKMDPMQGIGGLGEVITTKGV